MAEIRAAEWGEPDYWEGRIAGYLTGELHPRQARGPRVCFVAVEDSAIAGFAAGHLTTRFGCDGELQWMNVRPDVRRTGVASGLLRELATWFVANNALRICVDAEPGNSAARGFYRRHGAEDLNEHWLVWHDIGAVLRAR